MRETTRRFRFLVCAMAVLMLAPAAGRAQAAPDADTREILSYQLTEAGLGKYAQATRNLSGLQVDDCEDDAEARSLNDVVAKLDAAPGARAAVQAAGMTTREYVVFSFSLIQNGLAAWALEQPGGELPAGASKANVDFFRNHQAELQEIGEGAETSDCDDGN